MALVCNLGRTDRAVRMIIGAGMGLAAVLLRAHCIVSVTLGLAGFATLIGGAVGY